MKKALSVPEAAKRIGWTERTVWMQIYRRRFPHHRLGRKVFVLEDEIEEFFRRLPGATATEAAARAEEVGR